LLAQVCHAQHWFVDIMALSPCVPVLNTATQAGNLLVPAEICPADIDLVCHRILPNYHLLLTA